MRGGSTAGPGFQPQTAVDPFDYASGEEQANTEAAGLVTGHARAGPLDAWRRPGAAVMDFQSQVSLTPACLALQPVGRGFGSVVEDALDCLAQGLVGLGHPPGPRAPACPLQGGLVEATGDSRNADLTVTLPPPQRLRDTFNAADREQTDDNVDAVAKLDYAVNDAVTLQFSVGRKTRSPSHIERCLWLPLEVTAGLADGNNHVGNIGLDPEVAHTVDFGVEWSGGAGYVAPRIFFSDVEDFIDGKPASDPDVVAVSTLNGDPSPLQFGNVGAELYGLDMKRGHSLSEHWRVRGTISVVRGERDDGDDLFRLPADRAITAFRYTDGAWSATVEAELVAEQSRVSRTLVLDEPTTSNDDTPGHGLLHLSGSRQPATRFRIHGGIDNLLDKSHAIHVNGFNRVQGSDVALGERLPGTGRNVYVELTYDF